MQSHCPPGVKESPIIALSLMAVIFSLIPHALMAISEEKSIMEYHYLFLSLILRYAIFVVSLNKS
ncbi:hypothetical protein EDC54_1063 [Samsonia erythrinae]|uniref:Uncharacterized protein n=1 Tax=Samsonia erythrinae TaxID=160434 RepID=A0A4R3VMX7_9GAMM|nr:hypothetical protein EDC54_1063 [Samsonia erythrinae]